jgi:hypothetical protein
MSWGSTACISILGQASIGRWHGCRNRPDAARARLETPVGLLIRRRIADGDLAFFTTWCPVATSIETLVEVEGHRWAIEDGFETAKNEFGLDHNESRSWHGWHRHVSMVMLAFAMMSVIRHRANPPPGLGPLFAPCPWRWTLTMVASTMAYSMSGSLDAASNSRFQISAFTQSRKRV